MTKILFGFILSVVVRLTCSLSSAIIEDLNSNEEPEFVEQIENVTVSVGRSVRLSCSVMNLGSYKVAWMHFEQSAILTVNSHVITRNPRITVTHDKHRTWYLHINNVQEADRGRYMCQLNTIMAKTQYGFLNVVVPPNIDDALSSSDIIAREGSNVTLSCYAVGFPRPTIKWKRDDGMNMTINKTLTVTEWEGNQVSLIRISRMNMGAYLCIATNNVPPAVSKRIKVSVDFPPQLSIPNQLVGTSIASNVTLQCYTEAHPTSLNYWTREDNQMLHDNRKYRTENVAVTPSFKTHMKLTIFHVSEEDFGTYKCIAKNPRGETEGVIRLYLSEPKTTTPPPTTASTTTARRDIESNMEGISLNSGKEHSHKIRHKDRKNSGSSLNEINKSERKSHDKNPFGWNDARGINCSGGLFDLIKVRYVIVILLAASWFT